jgi:hypothetical protein
MEGNRKRGREHEQQEGRRTREDSQFIDVFSDTS